MFTGLTPLVTERGVECEQQAWFGSWLEAKFIIGYAEMKEATNLKKKKKKKNYSILACVTAHT